MGRASLRAFGEITRKMGVKMKKYLYGTTSLVGVGLLAGAIPVQAESDRIHLELGGFFHQWQGIADADVCQGGSTDCNDFEIVQVGEIFFNMVGKLENGIEISGRVELETQQDTDVIDAARVNISGSFGAFQLGQEDSARHNWAFDTAAPNEGILINSGWETAFAATSQTTFGLLRPSHSTALDFSDKAPKVTYFTPRMGGLQFAISWTPDTQTDVGTNPIGAGGGGSTGGVRFGTADKNTTYTNAIDLGIHYSGEFHGVGVTAQAGLGTVDTPDGLEGTAYDNDPEIYQAGVAISFENFTVAAGWAEVNDGMQLSAPSGLQSTEGESWTVGAGYSTGPWAVSAGYFHGEEEGSILNSGDDENDFFQVSTSYALSPGLGSQPSVSAHRPRGRRHGTGSGGRDSETDAVMLGVKVGF